METHFVTGLMNMGKKYNRVRKKKELLHKKDVIVLPKNFLNLLQELNISNDDYIRTTEERHKNVVSHLLNDLFDRGEIYQAEYAGFYSMRAEQFLQEKDKVNGNGQRFMVR